MPSRAIRKKTKSRSGGPQSAVYGWVKKIPKGRVLTYGTISLLIDKRLTPRAVGWMMHSSPKGVPWHRVVNASGGCSTDRLPDFPQGLQRYLLEREGVKFRANGTLDLKKHLWIPKKRSARVLSLAMAMLCIAGGPSSQASENLGLQVPRGFEVSVYADGLRAPRLMALNPKGEPCVAEMGGGKISCLPDANGDGRADGNRVVADGLTHPSSLAFFRDGSIYVGETTQVLKLESPDDNGKFKKKSVVIPDLPSGGHVTRTVLFEPDFSFLYVSVGSSCNVCVEGDPRRATIVRYRPDGTGETIFARGLRNAVGITFRPGTTELWATNNGRDHLGDDSPPETVQQVRFRENYGWPRCHAGTIIDPEFGKPGACNGVAQPRATMQAHSAPLGLGFYDGNKFPSEYQGDLFVAFHGSWNRSVPTGYKVVRLSKKSDFKGPAEDFVSGFLDPKKGVWARPVGILSAKDGSLLISDDAGGKIFRVTYRGEPRSGSGK